MIRCARILSLSAVACLTFGAMAAFAPGAGATTPPYGDHSDDSPAPCASGITDCPTKDAFFSPPSNLASLADGAVTGNRTATLATPSPAVKTAYTITYRSEDSFGAPVQDSGTVLLPTAPWTGTGSQPLVSWQFPEDSVGAQCRPSYDLAHSGTNSNVDAEQGTIESLLALGIEVVAPDFEGPAETYEVGPQSGHAVLDGIRAAESFTPDKLTSTTPVELNGYSGGAFATGWASELAKSYASSLNIVGASEGGTPADQSVTAHYLDGTVFVGFALLVNISNDRAFPALNIPAALNATGQKFFADNQGSCVGAATNYAFTHLDDYTTTPGLIDTPAYQATLNFNDLGQRFPSFPIFNYHVYTDELVPYQQDQLLVKKYCENGTPVEHLRIPAADHISGEVAGVPGVLSFIEARFAGADFINGCPEIEADSLLPQIPSAALPAGASAALPEAPMTVLLGVTGLAAGAWILRRRRRASLVSHP